MEFRFEWVSALAQGLPLTLNITLTCIAVGIVFGVLLALGRVYGNRPIRWLIAATSSSSEAHPFSSSCSSSTSGSRTGGSHSHGTRARSSPLD